MEAFVVVIFIGWVAYIIIKRSGRSQWRAAPQPKGTPQPDRLHFDADRSEPADPNYIICGPAYIVDGDTLVVRKTQIRLFGIDAPEMNHPYGQKAKWALYRLCNGQEVEVEVCAVDDYGRAVGQCFLPDGRDLSAEMVKLGLAIDWPKFSGGLYRQLEVPDARRKMWLADARQKGRMHVWEQFEAQQRGRT